MPKAIWNDTVIAQCDETVMLEGNHYFPPESIQSELFKPTSHHTFCGCKGTASYYDIVVDGETNAQAAWYYPDPKPESAQIAGHVAFWKGVRVEQ